MSSKRLRLILLISIAVLSLGFLGTYIVGMSLLSKKSQNMVDLRSESKSLDAQLESLSLAKKEAEQYSYFKDVAKSVIPNDKDQAQAVLDIVRMANESGISLQSIIFPASTLGGSSGSAPVAGAAPSTPPITSSTSAAISQAKPVAGIKGLYSLKVTITPDISLGLPPNKQVTYAKMLDFLQRIERNRRTAQITTVGIQPKTSETTKVINFSLDLNIFIKP
ncbi:hypothetical protein H0X09_00775 [Candidatus Saccharibacteria bacterium]|nr:hypothetical protein [Candidatus Saccharibacteria bacterium]